MKDITHIERSPLPWRKERQTECGLDPERHATWSREEAAAKAKELGRQRFSLFACMTCTHTAERHSTWEDDPASCLVRHASAMTRRYMGAEMDEDKRRFADELRAIAMLIDRHRDEFDVLVQGFGEVVDLRELRGRQRRTQGD